MIYIGEGSKGQWVDCYWTSFKITRQPFWKRHSWKSLGFCLQPQRTSTWHLKLKFQSKVELRCRNHVTYRVQKSNMATRQPFRKWCNWKSIGSYSYAQVLSHWSFEFIFKAKLKLESGNQKIQYGCQAAILELTQLKINRIIPIYISTVPLKFGVDIHSQTKVRVWKPKNPIWPPGGHFEINVAEINRLLPIYISIVPLKFGVDIQS